MSLTRVLCLVVLGDHPCTVNPRNYLLYYVDDDPLYNVPRQLTVQRWWAWERGYYPLYCVDDDPCTMFPGSLTALR